MDFGDKGQAAQEQDIERALASRKPRGIGLTHCENLDCGEAISETRRELGARLCIDCANEQEHRARQWRDNRGQ